MDDVDDIEIGNKFMVGVIGDDLSFPLAPVPRRLSKQDAMVLAAWLRVLADDEGDFDFDALVRRVQNA